MANLIGIMGEPGSGKSTSLRNLNSEETYYCDCDGKGLNWKGWRDQYSTDKRKTEKNNIDSKFNWLLRSTKQENTYCFSTTSHNDTARTPLGAFEEEYIPNDITKVIEVMKEF